MQTQIRLSPYNPSKPLKLVIDGASSIGTGFLLAQMRDEQRPEKGCDIVNAGSGLLPEGKDFSPVEAEAIALDRAMTACHHWIYYGEVELVSDWSFGDVRKTISRYSKSQTAEDNGEDSELLMETYTHQRQDKQNHRCIKQTMHSVIPLQSLL